MRLLPRLEDEQKSGAILVKSFPQTALFNLFPIEMNDIPLGFIELNAD